MYTGNLVRNLKDPRLIWLLLAALVLLYSGWIGYQYHRNRLYDFNLYYVAAFGFWHDYDVYAMGREYTTTNREAWKELAEEAGVQHYAPPYRYPPLTAQVVGLLSLFPPRTAGMVWLSLSVVCFIGSAWLLGTTTDDGIGLPLVLALLFFFVPALTTLHAGQVNGIALLGIAAGYWGLVRQKRIVAGLGMALGVLAKMIPIVLLLYLIWRRQWRAAVTATGTIIVLLLSSLATFSPTTLSSYFQHFFALGAVGLVFPTPPNQSLNGVLGRLLVGTVDEQTVYRLYLVGALSIVLLTIALCWPMKKLPGRWKYEYAMIVCALQMITPYAWYHQLLLLLVPLFVVIYRLIIEGKWIALAYLLLLYALSDVHGLFWHQTQGWRGLNSFPFLLTINLWVFLAFFILRARQEVSHAQIAPSSPMMPGSQ